MARPPIIFYLEDDIAIIRLVEKRLQHHDFPAKIIYFEQGEVFLDFIDRYSAISQEPNRDAIIILDLHLPDIHGIDVLEAIRLSPDVWVRQLPVIVFSISADPHDREKCESLGCTAYLQKSFEDDRLIEALQNIDADKTCAYGHERKNILFAISIIDIAIGFPDRRTATGR